MDAGSPRWREHWRPRRHGLALLEHGRPWVSRWWMASLLRDEHLLIGVFLCDVLPCGALLIIRVADVAEAAARAVAVAFMSNAGVGELLFMSS